MEEMEGSGLERYQMEGVEWMWRKTEERLGVILGDDMGMGKTAQALWLIKRVWERVGKSVVVVAPNTVLEGWEKEAEKFRIGIECEVVRSGTEDAKRKITSAEGRKILVIGYEAMLKREKLMRRMYFDMMVIDEAQRVKNKDTRISRVCREIDARTKVCITGTPIQNNLMELWSIVDMVRPKYLGDYSTFKTEMEEPLRRSKMKRAEEAEIRKGDAITKHLKKTVEEILLRRTKEEVGLEIPEKEEFEIYCPLTENQQRTYQDALQDDMVRTTIQGKNNPLKTIMHLRRICSHPMLNEKLEKSEERGRRGAGGKSEQSGRERAGKRRLSRAGDLKDSGKVQVLLRLMERWKEESRKVLVFSQYKEMLDILEEVLGKCVGKEQIRRIDGDTPIGKRIETISEFGKSDLAEVMLLTMRVGGVGVNIQKANTVVLFDMDWNPFNEEQAKGRAHRIGQRQKVETYRLLCKGTVEDSMKITQEIKKDIAKGILKGAEAKKLFEKVDLCRLFHYFHDPEDVTDIDEILKR